ncbi:YheC/YheD family protein [Paenibacillus physcomitrellae]|uniref:YheC/YheD family protein n=1 Tax=Paenibacillus physcomitrellae TaxID=1619311 RepID=A0ABQ1G153_9BACL|nr:YheC/YheD family protein [Paenibacillus physcomitrellae]GGA35351.1 hypothetical protein GCM10010917_20710 [Paenibacillus physcomitrellae]
MPGRQLADKWLKTEALLAEPSIAGHIPQTRLYDASNLKNMLHHFGMVVIKPVRGGGGFGVIKVEWNGRTYSFTKGTMKKVYRSFNALFAALAKAKVKRKYLIQQGIRLARISGRPIDYRVKVVKVGDSWQYRSMVGRLARPGLFVTNLCKGGRQLTARQGLSRCFSGKKAAFKRKEMRELTNTSIGVLENAFPGIGELGFDYGVDVSGKIWIFEVNTRPQ